MMSRSGQGASSNEEPSMLQQFQQFIKRWDEAKQDPTRVDPTDILTDMANILEKVNVC